MPTPTKPIRALDRIANSLERLLGLTIALPGEPIRDAFDLASRVQIASANFAAGQRDASAARDDDFRPAPPSAAEVW